VKRRSKNEGSLFFRKNIGLWVGELTLPDGRKKTKYGKTQGEVKKWLLEQRKAVSDGLYLSDESYTVEDFLKRYYEDVAKNTLAPRTLLSYEYIIRCHIVPEIGGVKLSQLRPEHLQTLYTKKLNSGLSRRTVQKIHQLIHTTLHIAYKWGLVLKNVADMVEPPTAEKAVPVILTVEEVNRLLEAVKGTREYALYACAASLGIREGELLALEWSDIDWTNKTITINKQVQYLPGKGITVKKPKTKTSIRTLPLPDVSLTALKNHKQFSPGTLVFSTGNGTYFYPRNVLRDFQVTLARLGLPVIPFHNLRHSCASYHLAMNTNPKIVSALLGHSSVTITLNTYSHLLPGVSEEAAKNINKIFS
jgi:integrase